VCRSHFAVMQATQALGTLTTLWTPSKRYYRINLSHLSKRAGDPIVRGWVCPNTNPRATQESPWLTFLLTNLTSRGTYKIATSLHHWRAIKKKRVFGIPLSMDSQDIAMLWWVHQLENARFTSLKLRWSSLLASCPL
jgi:hypothetical protein